MNTYGGKEQRVHGYNSLVLNDTLHTLFQHWSTDEDVVDLKARMFFMASTFGLFQSLSIWFLLFRCHFFPHCYSTIFCWFSHVPSIVHLCSFSLFCPCFSHSLARNDSLSLSLSPCVCCTQSLLRFFNASAFYAFVSTLLRFIFGTCCMGLKIGIESTNF